MRRSGRWSRPGASVLYAGLLLLHGPDGREIRVNPDQVTSLKAATSEPNKLLHDEAQCLVNLTDGKYVAVREPCVAIEKMREHER